MAAGGTAKLGTDCEPIVDGGSRLIPADSLAGAVGPASLVMTGDCFPTAAGELAPTDSRAFASGGLNDIAGLVPVVGGWDGGGWESGGSGDGILRSGAGRRRSLAPAVSAGVVCDAGGATVLGVTVLGAAALGAVARRRITFGDACCVLISDDGPDAWLAAGAGNRVKIDRGATGVAPDGRGSDRSRGASSAGKVSECDRSIAGFSEFAGPTSDPAALASPPLDGSDAMALMSPS